METFDPQEHPAQVEAYLRRCLGDGISLLQCERLTKSSREAPWRLDVETGVSQRSYVLRLGTTRSAHEYHVLRAMEPIPIPTPCAYGWDPGGDALGIPCFLIDYVEGRSLLGPVLAGETWAEALFLDTVRALQDVTPEQLSGTPQLSESANSAADVLETAYRYFKSNPHPVAETAYTKLTRTMPELPALRFSNGDVYLDNFIVRDRELAGVIDFESAGFSDPVFEFLLPFYVHPELYGRGIEERYCAHMGFDAAILPWYHALENFDTLHWVLKRGKPFVHHTADSLTSALAEWLDLAAT